MRKPAVAQLELVRTQDDPVDWLAQRLHVDFPSDGEVMRVRLSGIDREDAAPVLQAVIDAYLNEVVDVERIQQRQRLNELDRVYAEKETELREKLRDTIQLREQLGIAEDGREGAEAKSPKKRSIDVEMTEAETRQLEEILRQIGLEREKLRVELRGPSRVTLLQAAEAS